MLVRPSVDLKKAEEARSKYRPGTENGDATVGICDLPTCRRRIARSDNFVVTLAEKIYHTHCWPQLRIRRVFTNPDGTLKASIRQVLQAE